MIVLQALTLLLPVLIILLLGVFGSTFLLLRVWNAVLEVI